MDFLERKSGVRTLTRGQVEAALAGCDRSIYAAAEAVLQMAEKAYFKAAKSTEVDDSRLPFRDDVLGCLVTAYNLNDWPAVIRMSTHLIEEAVRSGEATAQ